MVRVSIENGPPLSESEKQQQVIAWLEALLAYAKGEKKWDTSGIWVDESNMLMPSHQGLWFENDSGLPWVGPGMPPYSPNVPVSNARQSAPPTL